MENQPNNARQLFLTVGSILAWFAVIFQFYLNLINRTQNLVEAIIRFFTYFTIQVNLLVALCFTVLWLTRKSGRSNFFSSPKTQTAIAVYIGIVGITYNTILRFTWNPQGWQRVVDELLHVVVPAFFILYWFLFASKNGLQWKNIFPWLAYPFAYIIVILLRGSVSGFYPYPFIDVDALGYNRVLINCGGMFAAFLLVSLLFVAVAKMRGNEPR